MVVFMPMLMGPGMSEIDTGMLRFEVSMKWDSSGDSSPREPSCSSSPSSSSSSKLSGSPSWRGSWVRRCLVDV
jgi:hypothetical protein